MASTGSSCYAITPSGKEVMAGGWGYFLGDQASAYSIGKGMIKQVVKEFDGRSAPSKLTPKVLEFLGFTDPGELVTWVYGSSSLPIQKVASVSMLCNDPELSNCVELEEAILNRTPHVKIISPDKSPAEGALNLARMGGQMKLLGMNTVVTVFGK